jgi:hypothetical protein
MRFLVLLVATFGLAFDAAIPIAKGNISMTADTTPQDKTMELSDGPATGGAAWKSYPVVSMRVNAHMNRR